MPQQRFVPLTKLLLLCNYNMAGARAFAGLDKNERVYGIVPEFRDRGLHAWLLFEQFVKAQERMEAAQLGWVEERNTEILENCTMIGGIQKRTWKVYEKPLNG
ncbi:MAG: hypothetical protein ABIP97_02940 [Chthoniobacterales bacterium]